MMTEKRQDVTLATTRDGALPTSPSIIAGGSTVSIIQSDILEDICQNNIQYYRNDETETGLRITAALNGILDTLVVLDKLYAEVEEFAPLYDFNEATPGNGHRSFLFICQSSKNHVKSLAKYVMLNRTSLIFRKTVYTKELEAGHQLLRSLCACLEYLKTLHGWSDDGCLFPSGVHTAEELFEKAQEINQYSFYGRCLGIHFCESMQSIIRFISICMAGFSEAYYRDTKGIFRATSSMWTSGKYYWNPELRARRIVNISRNAGIDFCKAFWCLTEGELMHTLPSVMGTSIKINKVITIPAEPLQLPKLNSIEMVEIPTPISHIGPGPVQARLLSYKIRKGMLGEKKNTQSALPESNALIFHCHGGGFVAQSSKSHELYLRDWAVSLKVPILSIDYSLAPDAPFPRAVEEVFYAYCWAIKNANFLGTTAEKIVLCGDSAGANLCLTIAIKCIELGIKKPDGIFLAYCPVRVSFDPSPARLICLMDPLLPFGFLMRCLKAYACQEKTTATAKEKRVQEYQAMKRTKAEYKAENSGSNSLTSSPRQSMRGQKLESDSGLQSEAQGNEDEDSERSNDLTEPGQSLWDGYLSSMNDEKSPMSDRTSDTFASAEFQNSQTLGNTEVITPDESNGISFEEDSQPITLHKLQNGESMIETGSPLTDGGGMGFAESASGSAEKEASAPTESIVKNPLSGTHRKINSDSNINNDENRDTSSMQALQQQIYKMAEHITSSVSSTIHSMRSSRSQEVADEDEAQRNMDELVSYSPSNEFVFNIPKDPYLSPYWASDEVLKQFPPTNILTVTLDPCLDDCVMFAKKLDRFKVPTKLDILDGLPHGFLNFSMMSKDAREGNNKCIGRIAELLNIEIDNPAQTTN